MIPCPPNLRPKLAQRTLPIPFLMYYVIITVTKNTRERRRVLVPKLNSKREKGYWYPPTLIFGLR